MKWWWWMEVIKAWMSSLLSVMRLVWITHLGLQNMMLLNTRAFPPGSPPPSLAPSDLLPSHHYQISAWAEQSVNIQQHSAGVSVCASAYFEGYNKACLVISKHGELAVQRVACVSLILPPTRIHGSNLLSDCDACEREIQSTSSASPHEWGRWNKEGHLKLQCLCQHNQLMISDDNW